jgi:tetratricopeptide (TPR) repeat protein
MPDDDELNFNLAEIYKEQDRLDDALVSINRAISAVPDQIVYQCFRVTLLSRLERYEEVITAAKESLLVDPEHWHSYDQLLRALSELGRVKEGEKEADALIDRYPRESDALECAGRYFYAEGNYERSLKLFTRALTIDSKSIEACYGRGLTYFEMDNFAAATKDFKKVVARDANSIGAHCRLSDSFLQLKEYEQAVSTAERLLKLDPSHLHAYVVIGNAQLQLGRTQEATKTFEALLTFTDADALASAARGARRNDLPTLSQKLIARALEIDPKNSEALGIAISLEIERSDFVAAWAVADLLGSRARFGEVAQAQAAHGALVDSLKSLLKSIDSVDHIEAKPSLARMVIRSMSASIRSLGPGSIPEAFRWLRGQTLVSSSSGLLGAIMTGLLVDIVPTIRGSREDWDTTVAALREALSDLSECGIPLAMLGAAVGFTFSQEQRYLLELPLEQRQLLESVLAKGKNTIH